MPEVLVTGADGFVGARLVEKLRADGDHVIALTRADGDIADPTTMAGVPAVSHVIHLAARTFVPDSWADAVGFHRTNVTGTACVLEYCRRHRVPLTFVSTYLYGRPTELPVDEDAPVSALNPYALTKLLGERMCAFHVTTHGLPVTIIRPFNVYGPDQRSEFLIPKVIAQVRAGGPVRVEDLAPRRDFVFVDDLVDALAVSIGRADGLSVYNIGSGESYSVSEVIDTVQRACGTQYPVESTGRVREGEIDDIRADITRAASELGWTPRVRFDEGIRLICASEQNVDRAVVEDFGREWTTFDQSALSDDERRRWFDAYFSVFPWEELPSGAVGFDAGCGSGRWALLAAPRVGHLHCVDPSAAIEVARRNLGHLSNVSFHQRRVDELPFADDSMDFGYSLGVLHHVPDTARAIADCVRKLKPGAPLLLYLYYAFDNRPFWYRWLWRTSETVRFAVSRLPAGPKYWLSQAIAAVVYWPLARAARVGEWAGLDVSNWPLTGYRQASFYMMRTDALDRFGTRLEQRFSREAIRAMMAAAGLERIRFSDAPPYWCAVGFKA